jgi:hypothetical protein
LTSFKLLDRIGLPPWGNNKKQNGKEGKAENKLEKSEIL